LNDPLKTKDSVLLVASLEDLLATKLKVILDRAEAKDYRDIAEMISKGVSLSSSDQKVLRSARDGIVEVPEAKLKKGLL
jgi:predicted nucleotidyltransferase component of viral defense system